MGWLTLNRAPEVPIPGGARPGTTPPLGGSESEGVVEILALLADQAAASPDELDWVGAGPLEDLLSHSGNGAAVLDEVERVARGRPAFAEALSAVWLGIGVEPAARSRLVPVGACDLSRCGASPPPPTRWEADA